MIKSTCSFKILICIFNRALAEEAARKKAQALKEEAVRKAELARQEELAAQAAAERAAELERKAEQARQEELAKQVKYNFFIYPNITSGYSMIIHTRRHVFRYLNIFKN